MNDFTLHRLYNGKGWDDDDWRDLRGDTVIVEPIRPPRQTEGVRIIAADQTVEIPGTIALLFRVVAVGPSVAEGNLDVNCGDVVALRNAALDPLHPNGNALRIDAKHIFSILERAG